jgi:hypothetical protein
MAKQVIAAPVVSLGLDSSGFSQGMTKAIPQAKAAGAKIGSTLASSMGGGGSLIGSLAAAAVPLNAALGIASMAANAAKAVLSSPMNSLMDREAYQAERSGLPLLTGSDAGYSGVFARLGQQWEDLLADMMVALDRAFDFRGWIEFFRGAMAGISVIARTIMGPLDEVKKDPEALTRQFKAGALFTIDTFETIGKISINIANVFIDLANWLKRIAEYFTKKNEDIAGGGAFTPEQEALIAREMVKMELNRAETIKGLRTVGLLPRPEKPAQDIPRLDAGRIVDIAAAARANAEKLGFAPKKNEEQNAAALSSKLIPMMKELQSARLGTALSSDSTALVEAVTKASVVGPGQDLQQRVAAAAEETVRQQKLTNKIQGDILNAYNAAGGDKRFKLLEQP